MRPSRPTPAATHDLRRAANTLLRISGVDLAIIRQMAGHESEEMTELYTTRLDSLLQDAVERISASSGVTRVVTVLQQASNS